MKIQVAWKRQTDNWWDAVIDWVDWSVELNPVTHRWHVIRDGEEDLGSRPTAKEAMKLAEELAQKERP